MKSLQRCKSCGAAIVYLSSREGGLTPVDASSAEPADDVYDHTRHVNHFATCPVAMAHRSPSLPKGHIVP